MTATLLTHIPKGLQRWCFLIYFPSWINLIEAALFLGAVGCGERAGSRQADSTQPHCTLSSRAGPPSGELIPGVPCEPLCL